MPGKFVWNEWRDKIDEAIRAGLTTIEFQEMHDIKRNEFYAAKPKGFHWSRIQRELNIKCVARVQAQKKATEASIIKNQVERKLGDVVSPTSIEMYRMRLASLAKHLADVPIGPESEKLIKEICLLHHLLMKMSVD